MEEIISFKGQNVSWINNLNYLTKERNIYIMDNHVAALWCWLQEIKTDKKYNILHIDAHYDTLSGRLDNWLKHLPDNLSSLSIQDYLDLKFYDLDFIDGYEIMRWDNYFPIFHRLFNDNINSYHFFTHKVGTLFKEMEDKLDEYPIPGLFNLIDYIFKESTSGEFKWIVNIDLDYFFQKIDDTDITLKFISDKAISFFLNKLKTYIDNDSIEVMTIALSPECCGSWENSIKIMKQFAKELNLEFTIDS